MHETNRNIAEVLAPAKINLCLYVGHVRVDGFHPVCSLMDRVTLADTILARRTPGEGLRLSTSGMGNDAPEKNLVMRAARALERQTGVSLEADIELKKKIPLAAGLGGGSSDAAAVLRLLTFLFGLDIHETQLREIAAGLGADAPFFLTGGPQLAEGKGEILRTVRFGFEYAAVIVNPGVSLSTADVYRHYDETGAAGGERFERHAEQMHEVAGKLDSLDSLLKLLHNDLDASARTLCPEIGGIEDEMRAAGAAGVLVSGSGPSVFGLFEDRNSAARAGGVLGKAWPHTWMVTPTPRDP